MSPAVVLVLALSAARSWACPTTGPEREQTAAAAGSGPHPQDSHSFALPVQATFSTDLETTWADLADFTTVFDPDSYLDDFSNWMDDDPDLNPVNVPIPSVPFECQLSDPLPVAEAATPSNTDPIDRFVVETLHPDHTRFRPISEQNPDRHNVGLPGSTVSPQRIIPHPESARDSGPSPAPSGPLDRKRKREAPGAENSGPRNSIDISSAHGIEPRSRSPPRREQHSKHIREARLCVLLPLLKKLANLDALQAESERHQVVSGARSGSVRRIPRLSESVQDRIELFAAHYLRHFRSPYRSPLSKADSIYRQSLECLLLCFYGHCGGDRDKFRRRFPKWGQCSFYSQCNQIHHCTYDVSPSERRSKSVSVDTDESESPVNARSNLRRHAHILRLIEDISLSADDYALARELEQPPQPPSVVPRIRWTAALRMAVVVAHYLRHYGPDSAPKFLEIQDAAYRNSLHLMIVCYYEHFGGDDAAFRAQYGEISCMRFSRFCSWKTACNAAERLSERQVEFRREADLRTSPSRAVMSSGRVETAALFGDLDDASANLIAGALSTMDESGGLSDSLQPSCRPPAVEMGVGPFPNRRAGHDRAPVPASADDAVAALGSFAADSTASSSAVSRPDRQNFCNQMRRFPWPPNQARRPWRPHLWSLLEKIPDLDQLKVEAERYELQLGAPPDDRERSRRIPHLSELVQDRIELFAAHYLRYFGPGVSARLCSLDITYALSLESLLVCFYDHCAGDRVEFDRRHPAWGQCNFHMLHCNAVAGCNYAAMNERRASYSLKSSMKLGRQVVSSNSWTGAFRGRKALVHDLVCGRLPSSEHFQQAGLREFCPSPKSVIPRILWSVGDPIEVVLAHYWRYFGPTASPTSLLQKLDQKFRHSLECLILCYIDHCGGNEAEFRRRCSSVSVKHFYKQCKGKFQCDLLAAPSLEGANNSEREEGRRAVFEKEFS